MIVYLSHTDQPVKDLRREYGVSEVTIYAWFKKFSPVEGRSSMTLDDNVKLQGENEI